ncbi:MAG: methyltransferase domain-containing protein, partial [Solirubrobacteraceae bacterium]
ERSHSPAAGACWGVRAVGHHGGRRVSLAFGSRAGPLPPALQRRLSLEGRVVGAPSTPAADGPPPGVHVAAASAGHEYDPIARLFREGAAPLRAPVPGMSVRECLHLAFVIPPFGIGSGGHNIIFQLIYQLELRGNTCSIWVFDPFGERANEWPAVMRRTIVENFAPVRAPLHKGFADWRGADVAVATSWQTVYAALAQGGVRARAYLINDHEPEFYATSVESRWAELTYRMGLHGISGSPWLAELYTERYGGVGGSFQYGVDHAVYRPTGLARRPDTVVFYARAVTGRRAVALGLLALAELHDRRPDVRIVMFGENRPIATSFPYEHLGVASPEQLARTFNEATVGLCLSLTNYSLIPQEMLACGLPCIDLLGASAESVFGGDGPVTLVPFDVDALTGALEGLLVDEGLRRRRAAQGIAFVADNSWAAAAGQVERELRLALRRREDGHEPSAPALAASGARGHGARPLARRGGAEQLEPFALGRARPPLTVEAEPVSERLFARLEEADVAAVESALTPAEREKWHGWPPENRQALTLAYGVHHGVPGVLERTGLRSAMPPEGVHAMARDVLAAGGGYRDADLVAEALRAAAVDLWDVRDGLDFGASSGRVVRVLAAAHPAASWSACDPNAPAIAWARENLPGIDFFVSPLEPPLESGDGAFDLAFAISVWSHYDRGAALRWLEEMARVVRAGGHLVLTTHGPQSVAYHAEHCSRPAAQLLEIVRALHTDGFWFAAEFGPTGDWGVVHPEWGGAFFTPEWLLSHIGRRWQVVHFMPGGVEGNQDVYVLRRLH